VLLDWSREVSSALDLDTTSTTTPDGVGLDVDERLIGDILALARDAAHAVERPAAPLTTFLVGYAAGLRGGGAASVAECAAVVRSLARAWRPTVDATRGPDGTGGDDDRGAG
jgi:hypothetical protein